MSSSERLIERRRVVYRGRVQGVGFRATATDIASNHKVTGFVRNQADGRVELEAQGEPAEIERFLAAVADSFERHLRGVERGAAAVVEGERGFEIRF